MSKILVSLCGVGMGHAARETPLIKELMKNNEVKVASYADGFRYINEFHPELKPIKFNGFKIIYFKGEYNEIITLFYNLPFLPIIIAKNFFIFKKIIKEFKPDLIVSDYDVFSLFAGKLFKVKSVLISNMHALKYFKINKKHKDFSLITGSLGIMPFVYDYLFVLSLKEKENTDKIKFFKMIVKDELINAEPEEKDFYIVYSDKFQLKNIIPLLEKINEKFIVFGLKGNAKNIEFHEKYSNEFFSEKLIECKGILSHGGMSLISEAIQLKKPVYTFTSAKFFERFYNGAVNEELGFGLVEETPSLKKLNEFFSRINEFKKNIEKSGIKAENNKILKEINKLIEK